jgi:hypothetical protein
MVVMLVLLMAAELVYLMAVLMADRMAVTLVV